MNKNNDNKIDQNNGNIPEINISSLKNYEEKEEFNNDNNNSFINNNKGIKLSDGNEFHVDNNKSMNKRGRPKPKQDGTAKIVEVNVDKTVRDLEKKQVALLEDQIELLKEDHQRGLTLQEINEIKEIQLKVMDSIKTLKGFYNNKFHKGREWTVLDYEAYINTLLPPLRWCQATMVEDNKSNVQFISFSHHAGTLTFLRSFFPYMNITTEAFFDNNHNVVATNLILEDLNHPCRKMSYYNAPGSTKSYGVGGKKSELTKAMKYHDVFKFLSTTYFPKNRENYYNLDNLLNVMVDFKAEFTYIHPSYEEIFFYALDSIAHFYISKKILPPRQKFNKNLLMSIFKPMKIKENNSIFYTDEEIEEDPDLKTLDNVIIKDDDIEEFGDIDEMANFIINDEVREKVKKLLEDKRKNILEIKKLLGLTINTLKIPRDFLTLREIFYKKITSYYGNLLPKGVVFNENNYKNEGYGSSSNNSKFVD